MALTGTASALAALIKANVDAVADKTNRDALFLAMAQAIITHIVANATVTVAVPAAPGAGVVGSGGLS